MLCDDLSIRARLQSFISRMVRDGELREDLLQEALIHVWLVEEQRPGQTTSWYVQSCKYHVRNCLSVGRSIDSLKRKHGQVGFTGDGDTSLEAALGQGADVAVLEQVSMQDIVSLLSERLAARDRMILEYLALGYGVRDIGKRIKLSHAAVIKRRRGIAALAIKLGIAPLRQHRRNHVRRAALAPV